LLLPAFSVSVRDEEGGADRRGGPREAEGGSDSKGGRRAPSWGRRPSRREEREEEREDDQDKDRRWAPLLNRGPPLASTAPAAPAAAGRSCCPAPGRAAPEPPRRRAADTTGFGCTVRGSWP
ncbi:unnamed protein product, partial [Prorocentrum cordatum]